MKKFFAIFLTVIIVLCFVVSVYLYAENAELREQGSLKVFSSRAYFAALSEIDFPEYDFASVLTSTGYYTYAELVAIATDSWLGRTFHNEREVERIANLALQGDYRYFTYKGVTYYAQAPSDPSDYTTVEDVLFTDHSSDGTFTEKVTYFFKYVGSCIKTVGKFVKAVLPFNNEYYVTTTVSSSFTVDASNYVGVSLLSGKYVFLHSNPYLKYSFDDTNTHSIVWLDSSGNVLDYGPLFDGDSSLYSTARAIYDRFYNVVKITLYESGETIE